VSPRFSTTHQDLQIVVVDNASTDGTRAVLAPFLADSRVTLLTSDKTIPAADNWNRARRRRGLAAGRMGGVATPAEDARV
jgi:glycosyltransferase involved in cell wall biosynthesis